MKFEEWLAQQDGVIEVDCGCVTTEAFYHWLRVAYEAGNPPVQSDCCPAQNQGWIPVGEQMPEDEQEVVTRNRMGHCFVSFFDKSSGLFFDRLDAPIEWSIEHVLVTHWMPLPPAPAGVKDE
ncbi:TPA: DUF551 domain-containing protein [Klebsiella variicola]